MIVASTKPTRNRRIPCVLMRGGSSRGPFFLASDLPADLETCNRVLIHVMGSPNSLQINGIGGGHPLTSKVAIVSRSPAEGVDIDYEFVQVLVESAAVDRKPNCGNMLSGVGPFAIESGLIKATDPETHVRIRNTNTGTVVDVVLQTPDGEVEYEGAAVVDGVPGTAAPIRMLFEDSRGAITGSLLPAHAPVTDLYGIQASLVDGAIPVMILAAEALGLRGDESAQEIDANARLFERVEALRRLAGLRMGLGDVAGQVVPKVALVSKSKRGGTFCVRYLTPDKCHQTLAVTGAVTLVMALFVPGTVVNALLDGLEAIEDVAIEHPQGMLRISVETEMDCNAQRQIKRLSTVRTAAKIFEGNIILPSDIWPTSI